MKYYRFKTFRILLFPKNRFAVEISIRRLSSIRESAGETLLEDVHVLQMGTCSIFYR